MKKPDGRRYFIRKSLTGTVVLALIPEVIFAAKSKNQAEKKIGIIGLDTSHSTAFTRMLNSSPTDPRLLGYRIFAAFPKGSNDIKSSVDRIPGYTEEVKKYGVKIVNSIEELLSIVDFILLETNDGRLHLEQAVPVFRAGKRVFIDKPVAASLSDAIAIYRLAKIYNVPIFSSSSLRYIPGASEITAGSAGKVIGAFTYSPATLEKTHPDIFWYGVHGVEILFTIMGTGCISVTRTFNEFSDVVTGVWNDGRIGTFRGIRSGKAEYGGIAFCENGIIPLGKYGGYEPLLYEIVKFFETGIPPVKPEETIEIFAFMTAAEDSKKRGGIPVKIENVMEPAKKEAEKIVKKYKSK
ncbi:MAG: Gfo/Idh/MocA family protein [Bacteroidales bacterium]